MLTLVQSQPALPLLLPSEQHTHHKRPWNGQSLKRQRHTHLKLHCSDSEIGITSQAKWQSGDFQWWSSPLRSMMHGTKKRGQAPTLLFPSVMENTLDPGVPPVLAGTASEIDTLRDITSQMSTCANWRDARDWWKRFPCHLSTVPATSVGENRAKKKGKNTRLQTSQRSTWKVFNAASWYTAPDTLISSAAEEFSLIEGVVGNRPRFCHVGLSRWQPDYGQIPVVKVSFRRKTALLCGGFAGKHRQTWCGLSLAYYSDKCAAPNPWKAVKMCKRLIQHNGMMHSSFLYTFS